MPRCGSLVIRTSPEVKLATEKCLIKCLTVSGNVPMKEGMLSVACAKAFPSGSVMTQEKSYDSRTTVEKADRSNEAAASSAAAIT